VKWYFLRHRTHSWHLRLLLMLDRAYDFAPSAYTSLRWEVRNLSRCCRCKEDPPRKVRIIFSVLLTSYDFLVFLFSSIRYFVHNLHLFLPLDLSSFLCLFNCFSFPSTTYETITAIKPEGLPPPSPVIDN